MRQIYFVPVLGAALVLTNGLFPSAPVYSPRVDEAGMKEKMADDLRQEVQMVVKAELQKYVKQINPSAQAGGKAPEPVPQVKYSNPALNYEKVVELADAELEAYIAGSINTGTGQGATTNSGAAQTVNPSSARPAASSEKQVMKELSGPERDADHAVQRTLIQKGGLLLRRGSLQVEPSFTTAHFSSNRINIEGFSILPVLVIGEISTQSVKRDILIGATAFRYGLWHNFQGEVKVPYRYEFSRVTSNLGVETTRNSSGIGDIDAGVSCQILHARGILPDLIVNMGVKSKTGADPYTNPIGMGTGHYGMRMGVVAVKTSDPAVVFGMLNYTWNMEKTVPEYGTMNPGNSVGFALGTAIALSYQTAINFQYEQSITSKLLRNGIPVNGSFLNASSLKVGFTWSLSEKTAIDIGISKGMTTDAPDYTLEFRIPHTF